MNEDNTTIPNDPYSHRMFDRLMLIHTVCRSTALSKEAKLEFVRLAAPICDAIQTYCTPPEDTIAGLYELARAGLIKLEINGYCYSSQLITNPPVFLPLRTLDHIQDKQLQNPLAGA
jgi:hypothetical protein